MKDEVRDCVALTNLDQLLFDDADATKRDLAQHGIVDNDSGGAPAKSTCQRADPLTIYGPIARQSGGSDQAHGDLTFARNGIPFQVRCP